MMMNLYNDKKKEKYSSRVIDKVAFTNQVSLSW